MSQGALQSSSKSTLSLWIKPSSSFATGYIIMIISRQDKMHYKNSFLMHIRKTNKTRLISPPSFLLFYKILYQGTWSI